MNRQIRVPAFGKFLNALRGAGVQTESARGFWGGVTPEGEIVVTGWIDRNDGHGRFKISRPHTNHGNLKTAWEVGNIQVGTEVRLILIRQRGRVPSGRLGRQIGAAALMPEKWKVVEVAPDGQSAQVESA
jgi:hypothetical protein